LLMTGTAEATPAREQGHAGLRERLAEVPDSRRTTVLREHVQALAQRVLGFPASRQIDFQQPLNELGLDSLMAVEFRNLLAAELDLNLPSTLLFNYPALEDVSGHLAGLLFKTVAPDKPATTRAGAPGDVLDDIENLSEEDVDRLLADKLGVSNG
jgi:acyl carrier protein